MSIFKRLILSFGVIAVLAAHWSGLVADASNQSTEPIKIGAVLHLTGDLASQSKAFLEGLELAVDEINEYGIRGRKLELIVEDGHNNSNASNAAARKLVHIDRIHAGVISSYLDAMSSGKVYEQAKIPVITLWDSNPEIEGIGEYVFAIGPWTPGSGEIAAKFAASDLNAERAVIVRSPDPFSEGVAEFFSSEFKRSGGKIVGSFMITSEQTDYRTLITKIKGLNPDVIYSPIVHNLVPFYSQVKQLGVKAPLISCDVITDNHINSAPTAFEGIYQTVILNPDSASFHDLAGKYRDKLGKEVTQKWFVAVGYDAMQILAKAIEKEGTLSETIKSGLYNIQDYQGTATKITFNDKGTSPQYEHIFQIRSGELELVR